MSDIDLNNAYNSIGESIHDLFDQIEEGFYVPLYQREYTWEEENINQLFDDIISGVCELVDEDGPPTTTFLGTAILTNLADKRDSVRPGEERAQPTAVKLVIDGQQRIATMALLSIQLTERLKTLSARLPEDTPHQMLKEHCIDLTDKLKHLFSLRLGRGATPTHKPKVIREGEDRWTYDGNDNSYSSPVALYIAKYIRTGDSSEAFKSIDPVGGARLRSNAKLIEKYLIAISDAHIPNTRLHNQFPVGAKVVTDRMQNYILGFSDAEIKKAVAGGNISHGSGNNLAAAIYQVFLFTYYLLRRCGLNRLQPAHEEWGFDMFQALNSTGTPLTAWETFVPLVMREEQRADQKWQQSPSKEFLDDIDELFESTTSNEQKNQRTSELLNAVCLCYEGNKLGRKFSRQQRWIASVYGQQLKLKSQRHEFLSNVAQVSKFLSSVWYRADESETNSIGRIKKHPESTLSLFLVQYLKDASSRLSAPVLARFFCQISDRDPDAKEFVEAVKACAAFFTLWRSAHSTSGLDDIYRRIFNVQNGVFRWNTNSGLIASIDLKRYFSEALQEKGIGDKPSWMQASKNYMLYTEVGTICRFALFVAGHDQIPDPHHPGLTRKGTNGVCDLLNLVRWKAPDHKSLEHVAPQNPPQGHSWDPEIYSKNKLQDVGNLIPLPRDINQYVDNKEWAVKFLHYSHVGNRSSEKIHALASRAEKKGIVLSKKATKTLSEAQFNCVVEPILGLGENGTWDAEFIERRTTQIKEITWNTLASWLAT